MTGQRQLRHGNVPRAGFTLLELMVAVTIVAALALLISPMVPIGDDASMSVRATADACRTAVVEQRVVLAEFVDAGSVVRMSCSPTALMVRTAEEM